MQVRRKSQLLERSILLDLIPIPDLLLKMGWLPVRLKIRTRCLRILWQHGTKKDVRVFAKAVLVQPVARLQDAVFRSACYDNLL